MPEQSWSILRFPRRCRQPGENSLVPTVDQTVPGTALLVVATSEPCMRSRDATRRVALFVPTILFHRFDAIELIISAAGVLGVSAVSVAQMRSR